MKRIAITILFLLAAKDAWAISRYDTMEMTCDEVHAVLDKEGAAILRYYSAGGFLPLYDRYVKSEEYCGMGEVVRRAGVPTADRQYCPVYKCIESEIFISR